MKIIHEDIVVNIEAINFGGDTWLTDGTGHQLRPVSSSPLIAGHVIGRDVDLIVTPQLLQCDYNDHSRFFSFEREAWLPPVSLESLSGLAFIRPKGGGDYSVVLLNTEKKINAIKELRAMTGMGLKEAKDIIEALPQVIANEVSREDALAIKDVFERNAGAIVKIESKKTLDAMRSPLPVVELADTVPSYWDSKYWYVVEKMQKIMSSLDGLSL